MLKGKMRFGDAAKCSCGSLLLQGVTLECYQGQLQDSSLGPVWLLTVRCQTEGRERQSFLKREQDMFRGRCLSCAPFFGPTLPLVRQIGNGGRGERKPLKNPKEPEVKIGQICTL
uniref:Uncharacterized protein n=1 Tax=Sphaerodactylus townsendi TaxID=933632 RepID=A0ACB8FL23_9SAUR